MLGARMKLYSGTTKRIFKKRVGKYGIESLNFGKTLKVGDLIYTCSGYNKRIKEIIPYYRVDGLSTKNWYISDFKIVTEDNRSCFLYHCIEPAKSKEEIIYLNSNWFEGLGLTVEEIVNENGELLVKE